MATVPLPYELPLLAGLARGHWLHQIAEATGTPFKTLDARRVRLMQRAQVPNGARLIDLAYREGWLAGLAPEPREPLLLTDRKSEILHAVASGMTNARIARHLDISTDTVLSHVKGLYSVLQARTRPHAVALGHQHQLLLPADAATRTRRPATAHFLPPALTSAA